MERFSIDNLLRYALAGGITALTLLYAYPDAGNRLFKVEGLKEDTILVGLVLLAGSFVYVLHRALIYPFFHRIGLLLFWGEIRRVSGWWCWYWVTERDVEIDMGRWISRENPKSVRKNLVEWAAQVHYLYCAAWSIGLGLGLGFFAHLSPDPNSKAIRQLLVAASILLLSAMVHHARLFYYDRKISDLEQHLSSSNRSQAFE